MYRLRCWLICLVLVGASAHVVLAQTASDSSQPLLIPCDVRDTSGTKVCSNDKSKTCSAHADCGEGNVCTPAILTNECTIADFFNQFVVLAQWGLTLIVVLGVLMMVYGGFQWITAGGRSSKVEEGRRVILGTLIGMIVSFSAYIIMNFTISAITGTTSRGLNPFSGPIATIFGDQTNPNNRGLEQPFSGSGTPLDTVTNCHDRWDKSCDNQIYCADISDKSGQIRQIQGWLNSKNCGCGKADGCYGSHTAICVRKFQIANSLPPTGELDQTTKNLIEGVGIGCGIPAPAEVIARVQSVNRILPTPSVSNAGRWSRTDRGCCVIGGSNAPLFCADQMSQRSCLSLGEGNLFIEGSRCSETPFASGLCGFCYLNNKCFGQTTQNWCDTKVSPPMSFTAQTGFGNSLCTTYIDSLRTTPP